MDMSDDSPVTVGVLKTVMVQVLTEVLADVATKDDIEAVRSEMATKRDIKRVEDKIDTVNGKVNDIVDNTQWLRGESPLADEDAA